ncbi:MAG: glycosyltransferase [Colwellia sp.]|nr:glycosyltransferase [Colwellia sp.]
MTAVNLKKKGLFIINSLEGGGAEKVFLNLVRLISLDDTKAYNIEVVLLDIKHEAYILPSDIKVHRLSKNKIFGFCKLFCLILKLKPDFTLSFLTRSNFISVFYSIVFNYVTFISERSNTKNRIRGNCKFLKKFIIKFIYSKATKIICCSVGVERGLINYLKINNEILTTINNPYNIKKLEQLASVHYELGEKYIVGIGRLTKTKGFVDLISAFSKLDTCIRLKILGDGPEIKNLLKLTLQLGISERVDFLGFVDNPYTIVKNSEFYVLSSYTEGFPNTLVEAMALAKPVISTNCPDGPNEILDYDVDIKEGSVVKANYGLIINTGDINAMHSAMNMLILDKNLYAHYEKKSLERASCYSEDIFYSKFKNIIESKIKCPDVAPK